MTPSSVVLALTFLATGYASTLCMTPPNPSPTKQNRYKTDRIGYLTGIPTALLRDINVCLFIYHVVLAFVLDNNDKETLNIICPYPDQLSPSIFTWSGTSIAAILSIGIGSAVRLAAYGGLGRNFTFRIAAPDQLVTTGVYQFVQHPGYTGMHLATYGTGALWLRWDGPMACWLSGGVVERLNGWGLYVYAAWVAFGLFVMRLRLRDEETMLKEKFGKEWEVWHARTKRFIPGLF
jgi:protein-S-isoprenylcysteine O-methyltransferase Ste14